VEEKEVKEWYREEWEDEEALLGRGDGDDS
jgi:hypothetical protein